MSWGMSWGKDVCGYWRSLKQMMFLLSEMLHWRERLNDVDTDSWLKLDYFVYEM